MADARELYNEGLQHFIAERYDEAIACYRRATEADPEFALGWNGLSMACQRKDDLEGALEAAKKLVELEPEDALAHTNLSVIYQRLGRIQEAEDEKAAAMQAQMRAQRQR